MVLQILRQFSWMLAEKIFSLSSVAIVGILIARTLGPYDFGILNYISAIAAITLAIGGFGLQGIVTRELKESPESEHELLGTTSVITTIGMAVVAIAFGFYCFYFDSMDERIRWLSILIVATCILRRFEFLESWFVVKSRVKIYVIPRFIITFIFVGIKLVLVWADAPLTQFVIVMAVEYAAIGIRSLGTYYAQHDRGPAWSWNVSAAKSLLLRSWPVMLGSILSMVYLKIDLVMLAWWVSPDEAGIYAAASRLSEIWYVLPVLFMTAVFPSLLAMRGIDLDRYSRALQLIMDGLCGLGTLLAIFIVFIAPFAISVLYGASYAAAGPILMIHILGAVFVFMRALLSKWLIAEDLFMYSLITHGAGAVTNLALNYLLIPPYGGIGAAVATAISYSIAGYFSLVFSKKTRPMFFVMSRSFLFICRLPYLAKAVRSRSFSDF